MRQLSTILFVVLFTGMVHASVAQDFQVSLPPSWHKLANSSGVLIYQNQRSANHAMILLRSLPLTKTSMISTEEMVSKAPDLQKVRAGILNLAGLKNYTGFGFRAKMPAPRSIASELLIEANYSDLQGLTVQDLELYFFSKDKIYQILYTETTNSLLDRERVLHQLDAIQPLPKSEHAFYNWPIELLVARALADDAVVSETSEPQSNEPAEVSQPKPPEDNACKKLVPNDLRRRTPVDPPFASTQGIGKAALGCLVMAPYDIGEETWDLYWKSTWGWALNLGDNLSKYRNDEKFKATTDGQAQLILERVKDPTGFANQVLKGIGSLLANFSPYFQCLNTEAQWRLGCRVAIELYTAYKGSISALSLARGVLSKAELVKVEEVTAKVIKEETLEPPRPPAIAAPGDFRAAVQIGDFSAPENRYISFTEYRTSAGGASGTGRRGQVLGKTADGKLQIELLEPNGSQQIVTLKPDEVQGAKYSVNTQMEFERVANDSPLNHFRDLFSKPIAEWTEDDSFVTFSKDGKQYFARVIGKTKTALMVQVREVKASGSGNGRSLVPYQDDSELISRSSVEGKDLLKVRHSHLARDWFRSEQGQRAIAGRNANMERAMKQLDARVAEINAWSIDKEVFSSDPKTGKILTDAVQNYQTKLRQAVQDTLNLENGKPKKTAQQAAQEIKSAYHSMMKQFHPDSLDSKTAPFIDHTFYDALQKWRNLALEQLAWKSGDSP